MLYRTILAHLLTFIARTADDAERSGSPAFVKREFQPISSGRASSAVPAPPP